VLLRIMRTLYLEGIAVVCSSQSASDRIRGLVCGLPKKLRQERLLLMLQGYFDDSGTDGQQVGFVLAGYILPAERWEAFADDWQDECQRDPKIEYFKMREAASGYGAFLSMPIEFRLYKVRRLLALIDNHMLHGITTNLRWEDFREFNAQLVGPAKDQPFAPLFFGILDNVLEYQQQKGLFPHKIQLDFDEQGGAGRLAIDYYGKLMDLAEKYGDTAKEFATIKALREIMEGTPRMLDDRQYLPLQAADMLAWSLRLQMEPEEVVKENPFAWLYDEIRKTVWSGSRRFAKQTWNNIGQLLSQIRPVTPPPD
jgi:hypothetical protein